MFIIFSIVAVAMALLILSAFKGSKKAESPEIFLKNLGYSYKLIDEKKIIIPKNFGENMQKYNELQKSQGFDLKKYSGRVCIQQKYAVNKGDYYDSDGDSNNNKYIADLIVFNGVVVGGSLRGELYGSEPKCF